MAPTGRAQHGVVESILSCISSRLSLVSSHPPPPPCPLLLFCDRSITLSHGDPGVPVAMFPGFLPMVLIGGSFPEDAW